MANYIALIRKEANSIFGVDFPDFPGCISASATLDAALRDAQQALVLHVKGLIEDGEDIPSPCSLDKVMQDKHNRDAVPALVSLPEEKGRAIRVNITVEENLLRQLDEAAAKIGTTRSGFLAEATRAMLRSVRDERDREIINRHADELNAEMNEVLAIQNDKRRDS